MVSGSEGVNANRRLEIHVLAPVDKYFSTSDFLGHDGGDLIREAQCERLGAEARKFCGIFISQRAVEGNIKVESLAPGCLWKRLQFPLSQKAGEKYCDLRAFLQSSALARVEVKNYRIRALHFSDSRQRRVKFDGRQVGDPDQRRKVIDEAIVHILKIASPDPTWAMSGAAFFVKTFTIDP